MVHVHIKIGQGMRIHFEKLVKWHGKKKLIPVCNENNIFNFYLNREVKSTGINKVNEADHYSTMAEQCARKSDENSESRCSINW